MATVASEAFAAWRRFFEELAAQRPLVLVFEDLQWADDGLLDFVDELVDWVTDVPLLVVCTARPELLARRPDWGGGKLNASTIALEPLSDEETARLMAHLLDRSVLPADVQQTLLDRAGGNPLYAEQFAQLYVERGSAEELPLPETLQGIIGARLDGLPAEEKALLHAAAVVGKVFWTGALGRDEATTPKRLHSLERKGFVRRQRRSSVAGEVELAFAHALVRDVAYGQIPRAERAARHRAVAEWIESLGRAEDHAEMVAYHWRAGPRARAMPRDRTPSKSRATPERPSGTRATGHSLLNGSCGCGGLLRRGARALARERRRAAGPPLPVCTGPVHRRRRSAARMRSRKRGTRCSLRAIARPRRRRKSSSPTFGGTAEDAMTRFAHLARAEELAGRTQSPAKRVCSRTSARRRAIGGEPERRFAHRQRSSCNGGSARARRPASACVATIGFRERRDR